MTLQNLLLYFLYKKLLHFYETLPKQPKVNTDKNNSLSPNIRSMA